MRLPAFSFAVAAIALVCEAEAQDTGYCLSKTGHRCGVYTDFSPNGHQAGKTAQQCYEWTLTREYPWNQAFILNPGSGVRGGTGAGDCYPINANIDEDGNCLGALDPPSSGNWIGWGYDTWIVHGTGNSTTHPNSYTCYDVSTETYTTYNPTTEQPTSAPTNAPTYKIEWDIAFQDLLANFTRESDQELTLDYKVGKDRQVASHIYKDCDGEEAIADISNVITNIGTAGSRDSFNATHDTFTLAYDVNKTAVATSSVWNSTSNEIKFCQVLQLMENSTGAEHIITTDKREIEINFNLTVNYNTGTNLTDGTIGNATDSTDVSSSVAAYKCGGQNDYVPDSDPLSPNSELHICIVSTDDAIEVDELISMVIAQGGYSLLVVNGRIITTPQITDKTFKPDRSGVAVSTRVPSNLFDFAAGESITISGEILMKLVGSNRKLRALVGDADAAANADPNEASYEVQVELKDEAGLALEDEVPIGNSGPTKAKELAILGVAALASFLMMW